MAQNYKNAFKCHRCPGNASERGCPCWVKDIWEDEVSGNVQVIEGCIFQSIPRYLKWNAGRSALAAATVQELRNENERVIGAFGKTLHLMQHVMDTALLEDKSDGSGTAEETGE